MKGYIVQISNDFDKIINDGYFIYDKKDNPEELEIIKSIKNGEILLFYFVGYKNDKDHIRFIGIVKDKEINNRKILFDLYESKAKGKILDNDGIWWHTEAKEDTNLNGCGNDRPLFFLSDRENIQMCGFNLYYFKSNDIIKIIEYEGKSITEITEGTLLLVLLKFFLSNAYDFDGLSQKDNDKKKIWEYDEKKEVYGDYKSLRPKLQRIIMQFEIFYSVLKSEKYNVWYTTHNVSKSKKDENLQYFFGKNFIHTLKNLSEEYPTFFKGETIVEIDGLIKVIEIISPDKNYDCEDEKPEALSEFTTLVATIINSILSFILSEKENQIISDELCIKHWEKVRIDKELQKCGHCGKIFSISLIQCPSCDAKIGKEEETIKRKGILKKEKEQQNERNNKALIICKDFEEKFRNWVVKQLKNRYNEKWWNQGVLENIKENCKKMRNDDIKQKYKPSEIFKYMNFFDLYLLIEWKQNSDIFHSFFPLDLSRLKTRLSELKYYRNITVHIRGDISNEDLTKIYLFISDIETWINNPQNEKEIK